MGTFKWPLRIASMDGQQARDIEATVDTGASFTTLPSNLLRELGIEATGKRRFLLADGRRIEMDYGQAWATIDGESVVTIVVFGEDEAPPLLGGLHSGGSGVGGGPGGSTAGPHSHDPVLGRCGAGRVPSSRTSQSPGPYGAHQSSSSASSSTVREPAPCFRM